jgi:hypothetical protein
MFSVQWDIRSQENEALPQKEAGRERRKETEEQICLFLSISPCERIAFGKDGRMHGSFETNVSIVVTKIP